MPNKDPLPAKGCHVPTSAEKVYADTWATAGTAARHDANAKDRSPLAWGANGMLESVVSRLGQRLPAGEAGRRCVIKAA